MRIQLVAHRGPSLHQARCHQSEVMEALRPTDLVQVREEEVSCMLKGERLMGMELPMMEVQSVLVAVCPLEGGPMTGYELRLQGCEQRGELEVDSGQAAWTQSLTWEGLLQLPCWMGIATVPSPPPRLERHEEDSESDGSFEVMTSGG